MYIMRLFVCIFIVTVSVVITISQDEKKDDIVVECMKRLNIPLTKKFYQLSNFELKLILLEMKSKYSEMKASYGVLDANYKNLKEGLGDIKMENLFYQTLLGIRKLIEYLENFFYPRYFPKANKRRERWLIILHMVNNPKIDRIRKAIGKKFITNGIERFAQAVSKLYSDNSNILGAKIDVPNVPIEVLQKAFAKFKVNLNADTEILSAYFVMFEFIAECYKHQPVKIPAEKQEELIKNARCILMKNVPFPTSEKSSRKIPGRDIKTFFKPKQANTAIEEICKTIESHTSGSITGNVIVKFAGEVNAAAGFLDHNETINRNIIELELMNCDEWETLCHPEAITNLIPKWPKASSPCSKNSDPNI